jgi:hypothetical protein
MPNVVLDGQIEVLQWYDFGLGILLSEIALREFKKE